MDKFLTIVIPTYNRKNQLVRLLKSIERQNALKKYYVVILNNHSNYDIESTLNNCFSSEFIKNIEINNRPINVGASYNISGAFLACKTDYLWIIGDDDEVIDGAIDIIEEDIIRFPNIPLFKYSLKGSTNEWVVSSISEVISLNKHNYLIAGNIIYISNSIFKISLLKDYLSYLFIYSYSAIPHTIPMIYCIANRKDIFFSTKDIIYYNAPEGDHWDYISTTLALSSLLDINISGQYDVVKSFFKMIARHFDFNVFLKECLKIENRDYRAYVVRRGIGTFFRLSRPKALLLYLLFKTEVIFHVNLFTLYNRLKDRWYCKKESLKRENNFIYKMYLRIK